MLACASRFSLVFHFAAQLTAENFFQPVGRSLRCLDQLAGDETSNEAVASSVFGIVIHEKIIGVFASLRQTPHGLFVGLWNCAKRDALPALTHPQKHASYVEVGIFRRNEKDLCCVAGLPRVLQQLQIHSPIFNCKRALLEQHLLSLMRDGRN